ncbi:MAG: hypothetical protein GXP62_17010, partial [Oligoflexia bacterium]|nr:hypothetical protein [Oligoflexia bacterium]
PQYFEWLGLSRGDMLTHHYTLTLGEGINAAVILGGRAVAATLTYTNDSGMRWVAETDLLIATASGGVGAAVDGEGAHLSSPEFTVDIIHAGKPMEAEPALVYFSMDDFSAANVYLAEVTDGAEGDLPGRHAAVGLAASGLMLEHDGHRISFPPEVEPEAGVNERPTSSELSGGVGATVTGGIGTATGLRDAVVDNRQMQPLAEHDYQQEAASAEILLTATLYFRTAEAALGPEDQQTIDDVVGQIWRVDHNYPGALFELHITGYASQRWRSASSAEDALSRNEALAQRRTQAVQGALHQRLQDVQAAFTQNVLPLSELSADVAPGPVVGSGPEDNDQLGRVVYIDVRWQPGDSSRRAASWSMGD